MTLFSQFKARYLTQKWRFVKSISFAQYWMLLGALLMVVLTGVVIWSSQRTELLANLTLSQIQLNSSIKLDALRDAKELVNMQNQTPLEIVIEYLGGDTIHTRKIQVALQDTGFTYSVDESAFDQLSLENSTPFFQDGVLRGAAQDIIEYEIAQLSLDHGQWSELVEQIDEWISRPAKPAKLDWTPTQGWVYQEPKIGRKLSEQSLQKAEDLLTRQLSRGVIPHQVTLQVEEISPPALFGQSTAMHSEFEQIKTLTQSPLILQVQGDQHFLDLNNQKSFLHIDSDGVMLNEKPIRKWLEEFSQEVFREPTTVHIVDTEEIPYGSQKAITEGEFKEGQRIHVDEVFSQLQEKVQQLLVDPEADRNIDVRVYEIPVKIYSDVENTAYDLLAVGYSEYSKGNASSRVHNIQTGLGRINQSIVGPGEEISFNALNGPIDYDFEVGYAIFGSIAKPSLGGGICQVSTTFYRALLNLGVPITMRKNHSWDLSYYRVGGYGLDATIYPSAGLDVKAVNDYGSNLYFYSYTRPETEEAFILIYGKGDGRSVTIEPEKEYLPFYGPKTLRWTQTVQMPDGTVKTNDIVSRYSM